MDESEGPGPWQIDESSQDHWLTLRDPKGVWKADVKWDGCVDLLHQGDYFHICELDDFIERLQALRKIAVDYFEQKRGEWPG